MIEEGEVKIFGEGRFYKGPGKKQAGFYNPTLEIDRDINVIFCQYIANKGAKKFLDGLASTGIRGIRIVKEIEGDIEMDINDLNEKSYEIIKKNIEINGIKANALNENLCLLLQKNRYDYVDIDPYGSPLTFIPFLFNGIKRKAFASFTATDVATLCGVYKKACIRKYNAVPLRGQAMKEIGTRILMGYIARLSASFEYGFYPLLSYSYGHFFRIYAKFEKSIAKANENMENIGWIYWENGWKFCLYGDIPNKKFGGPLWIGKLHDEMVLNEMEKILKAKNFMKKKELKRLFMLFKEEINLPILYYESNYIAREMKTKQPKISKIIETLQSKGYKAGRCHFMPNAFKTDADYEKIKEIFK